MCEFKKPDCLNCPYPECNASVTDIRAQWKYSKATKARDNADRVQKKVGSHVKAIRIGGKGMDVIVSDAICKKCLYHSPVGMGAQLIACMYADRAGKCRSLEPDYEHGKCRHFTKGKPTHDDWMRNKRIAIGGNDGYTERN